MSNMSSQNSTRLPSRTGRVVDPTFMKKLDAVVEKFLLEFESKITSVEARFDEFERTEQSSDCDFP